MTKTLYVVGIGAGNAEGLTIEAQNVLMSVSLIVGYQGYVDLLQKMLPGLQAAYYTTGMRGEKERCIYALQRAQEVESVAVICSGDAGVYGMASLLFELSEGYQDMELRIVPGVTAALSGAALLGAPLGHDFCVISLSDLLTPEETIQRRLRAAAKGDFCIVLYNPASHKRTDALQKACDILLESLPEDRLCGIAERIGREGEQVRICTLSELRDSSADMFMTVFIGNAATRLVNGRLVTPRGYREV